MGTAINSPPDRHYIDQHIVASTIICFRNLHRSHNRINHNFPSSNIFRIKCRNFSHHNHRIQARKPDRNSFRYNSTAPRRHQKYTISQATFMSIKYYQKMGHHFIQMPNLFPCRISHDHDHSKVIHNSIHHSTLQHLGISKENSIVYCVM